MQFVGLEPLREGFPTIEVVTPNWKFDLHNDAEIRQIAIDFRDNELSVTWTLKQAAWTDPAHPEPSQRRTVAGIVLAFSGVRSVKTSGGFLHTSDIEDRTVDFLEYSRLELGLGRIRIVFENDADITIVASRCRLLEINKS